MTQLDGQKHFSKSAFKSIRETSNGLVSEVVTSRTTHADQCINDGSGLITVSMPSSFTLDSKLPFLVDGVEAEYVNFTPPHLDLVLYDAEAAISSKPLVEQKVPTTAPEKVADELTAYWCQYWNAPAPDGVSTHERWHQFDNLLNHLPQQALLEVSILDITLWREAIRSMKSESATGCCGWYVDELKDLPDCALHDLVAIIHKDCSQGFPSWLMKARVIPLAKVPGATAARQSRPITILSIVYRLWARVVTRQILSCWSCSFPSSVTGFLPGRSPHHLLYLLQSELEAVSRLQTANTFGGVTLDLVKAFNLLPRDPCKRLLLKLGLPPWLIHQWFESISSMQRFWHLDRQLFPVPLPTGFPEGDTWSVLCMLSVCRLWASLLKPHDISNNTFADNWSWFVQDPTLHSTAIEITLHLTQAMELKVDWDKTWCWATSQSHKTALQAAKNALLPPTTKFSLVTSARELGIILHYRDAAFRGPQKTRHRDAIARIRRVKRLKLPIKTKAKLIMASCYPKAYHGTEMYLCGQKFFDTVRSEVAHAILGDYHNLCTQLVVMCTSSHLLDPELYVIQKAIVAARKFLVQSTPECQTQFLRLVATFRGQMARANGPAAALNCYLAKLGWQVDRQGKLNTDGLLDLHLMHSPMEDILATLEHSWMVKNSHDMCRLRTRNFPIINRRLTLQAFEQLPEKMQVTIGLEIANGSMMAYQKEHFLVDVTKTCAYCTQDDSREHRLLECEATQLARGQYTDVCQQLMQFNPVHWHFPVIFWDQRELFHQLVQHAFPPPVVTWPANNPMIVYTDGSCQQPTMPEVRWATYALVAQKITDPELFASLHLPPVDLLDKCYHIVAVAHVPGRQTIPRAELAAAVTFYEERTHSQQNICTDSAYVIRSVATVRKLTDPKSLFFQKNSDMMIRLFFALQRFDITPEPIKVKSHESLLDGTPSLRKLRAGNSAADEAAKQTALQTIRPLVEEKLLLGREYKECLGFLAKDFQMRYALAMQRVQLDKQQAADDIVAAGTSDRQLTMEYRMRHWTIPNHVQFSTQQDDMAAVLASRWGVEYTSQLIEWAAALQWPPERGTPDQVGITWVELAINFWLTTQQAPKLNLSKSGQEPKIVDIYANEAFNPDDYTFTALTNAFNGFVQHTNFLLGRDFMYLQTRTKVSSLFQLGAKVFKQGLAIRPVLPHQSQTIDILQQYIGANQAGDTPLNFRTHPCIPKQQPLFLPKFSTPDGFTYSNWLKRYNDRRKELQTRRRAMVG